MVLKRKTTVEYHSCRFLTFLPFALWKIFSLRKMYHIYIYNLYAYIYNLYIYIINRLLFETSQSVCGNLVFQKECIEFYLISFSNQWEAVAQRFSRYNTMGASKGEISICEARSSIGTKQTYSDTETWFHVQRNVYICQASHAGTN